ncbi:uncharacterized protein LOC144273911 [Eretmochelys imbricata]
MGRGSPTPLRPCWACSNCCPSIKESSSAQSGLTAKEEGRLVEAQAQKPLQPFPVGARDPETQTGDMSLTADRQELESQRVTCTEEPGDPNVIGTTTSGSTVADESLKEWRQKSPALVHGARTHLLGIHICIYSKKKI